MTLDEAEALMKADRLDEALEALNAVVAAEPKNALAWYRRGRLMSRLGRHGDAKTDYMRALALDPQSPARFALEHTDDILDFFNPDLLNP